MTNSELIEELASAAVFSRNGEPLPSAYADMPESIKSQYRKQVRAVLLRLADLGSSSEMDLAVAGAVRYLEPGEWDAAFTASLRSLANE